LDTYEKQHANIEVLKESNKALEKRLSAMDDLRKQSAIAQAEADDLKREKREWYVHFFISFENSY
jgi:FtsZ-binding cell division protein ZapB